jgi:membrane-associated phospholipid phosphatase
MLHVIRNNFALYYLWPLAAIWTGASIFLFSYGYHGSFIFLNSFHLHVLDIPALVITHFGDALLLSGIVVGALWKKKPAMSVVLVISVFVSGMISVFLKNYVFDDWLRPPKIFEATGQVHLVGNYILYNRSFPSGHAITVNAVFLILAYSVRTRPLLVVACLICGLLISYSRIYTGVHFLGDVLAGSLIGSAVSAIAIMILRDREESWDKEISQFKHLNKFTYWAAFVAIVAAVMKILVDLF